MNITLQRTFQNTECTQGTLALPNSVLYTLELSWVEDDGYPGGMPDRSCVPAGLYQLALHDTQKHPQTFALVNPGLSVIHEPDPNFPNARVACLIHVANFPRDLEGCIGVGTAAGDCMIRNSQIALTEFKNQVPWITGHSLTIVNPQ